VLNQSEYRALADFRYELRKFLRFSEEAARAAGYETQQYQFLLAIKGLPPHLTPTLSTLAERMQLKHNTVVELAGRCEARGLLLRQASPTDARAVLLKLTPQGEKVISALALEHALELRLRGRELLRSLALVRRRAGLGRGRVA